MIPGGKKIKNYCLRRLVPAGGFTFIELMMVVLIIGILAAIAFPMFLHQREKAWLAAVKSDLYNAAIAQSSYKSEFEDYTSRLADLRSQGFNASSAVTLTIEESLPVSYCMEAFHNQNAEVVWHVRSGEGEPMPSEGPCI